VPRWLKIVLLIVVIAVSVVLLFTVVFPRVEQILEDPTMGASAPAVPAAPVAERAETEVAA
jgi:hypothetical protein